MKILSALLLLSFAVNGQPIGPPIKQGDSVVNRRVFVEIADGIYFDKWFSFNLGKPPRDTIIKTVYIYDTIYIKDTTPSKPTPSGAIRFKPTHFSTYLQWDFVPGAQFYTVLRDDKRLCDITGNDTWDGILEPDHEYNYQVVPWDSTGKNYPIITARCKTLSNGLVINIAGDGNLYDRFKDAVNQPNVTTINVNGWMAGPAIDIANSRILISGNVRFGFDGVPSQQMITHKAGVLGFKGTFMGPDSYPVRINMSRPDVILYRKDINTNQLCELHLQGIFGDSTDYQKGWVNLARNIRGIRTTGKEVIAIYNSTLAVAEPFELRPFSDTKIVTPEFGKRLIIRNVRVHGSGFNKNGRLAAGSITRYNDSLALVTIDSVRYRSFSFNEFTAFNRQSQYIIFKNPLTPAGGLNQFENSAIRPVWYRLSNYMALVPISEAYFTPFAKPMIYGPVILVNTPTMQPTIWPEGHLAYSQAMNEHEYDGVYLKGLFTLCLRMSDAPEWDKTSGHRQMSMNNISFEAPVNDTRFDDAYKFGGYVQKKDWPNSGPEIEIQQQGFVGLGLMLNCRTRVLKANVPIYVR